MKHSTLETNWDSIKGKLKQRYGQLTDDDFTFASGKAGELLARLREKLGLSEHDLNGVIDELKDTAGSRVDQAKAKVADISEDVRARVGSVVEDLKARGGAAAEEVKAQAEAACEETRKRVRTLREDGREYVRHNPRESLVAALCAGFVAGLLIRR